jgi:hypothetical protein
VVAGCSSSSSGGGNGGVLQAIRAQQHLHSSSSSSSSSDQQRQSHMQQQQQQQGTLQQQQPSTLQQQQPLPPASFTQAEVLAARAHVFGQAQHAPDGKRSGRRALLRPLRGRFIADWYFTLTTPPLPMLEDELEEE